MGNIVTVNENCCNLFNYTKKEMLRLRVNEIMPTCYSEIHDSILSRFLKHRSSRINTDNRNIFGKNRNHFIFPMILQLRALSWNNNDELIFISSLEGVKNHSAPISCIIDQEGDIQDYTSTFAYLFMKKVRNNNQIKSKNIQELIPSFFEVVENQKVTEAKKLIFPERVSAKKKTQ